MLEISWTVIPAVILAVMAVPTVATIFSLAKKPTGPNVVHVTVTARQWWWEFHYDDPGNGVETANELHIPVGQPDRAHAAGPARLLARALLPERRDPLVLGSRAERQEGRRSRAARST